LTAHSRSNDPDPSFPIQSMETGEVAGWCHGRWWGISGLLYGALFFDVILPTQPRWHKGSILLTSGGEISSPMAGDVGAAWVDLNGDEFLSRRLSGSKGTLWSFLELASSSSIAQLLQKAMKNLSWVAS
jgi:hypothetical protein